MTQHYLISTRPSGGLTPYHASVVTGSLPTGLQSNVDNADFLNIGGFPTATGTFPFTIQWSDSQVPPATINQNFSIRINSVITTNIPGSMPAGLEGQPYNFQFTATGGVPPYNWFVSNGPPGLTMGLTTGLFQGTPTGAFDGGLSITLTDSAQPPQRIFGFPPTHLAALLHITTSSLPQVVSNSDVTMQLGMRGGTGPFDWSISSGALPAGLTLSPIGLISGKVTGATTPFTVRLSDQGLPPQSTTATLTLPVSAAIGRNDTITTATPISNGSYVASISPIADPPGATPAPDVDFFKITADPGACAFRRVRSIR